MKEIDRYTTCYRDAKKERVLYTSVYTDDDELVSCHCYKALSVNCDGTYLGADGTI